VTQKKMAADYKCFSYSCFSFFKTWPTGLIKFLLDEGQVFLLNLALYADTCHIFSFFMFEFLFAIFSELNL
jgi:hypothetical protein